jgi:hypothetical protein
MAEGTRARRLAGVLMALGLAAAFFFVAARKLSGDVFNSYPFVTLDGYDWLLDGNALAAQLHGQRTVALPVLRNPVYIFCVAVDVALGGTGRWLLAIHAGAFLAQMALLWMAGELLGTDRRLQLATPVLLALSALGTYRFAIFPDDVAIAFLLGSLVALLLWLRQGRRRWLAAAGVAAWAGALTQEYAATPLVAAVLIEALQAWRQRRPPARGLLLTAAVAGMAFLAASQVWSAAIPHHFARDVWSVFRHSLIGRTTLLKFDLLLWLHVFWPLAGVLAAALVLLRRAGAFGRQAAALIGTTIALLALLILGYGWPDSRFTYVLIPLVLLLCDAGWTRESLPAPPERWPRRRLWRWLASPLLATFVWCGQGWGFLPALGRWKVEAVQPLHAADGAVRQGWPRVAEAAALAPVDRFALARSCGSVAAFCPAAVSPRAENEYDRLTFCEYRAFRLQGVVGLCPYHTRIQTVRLVSESASGVVTCSIDATHLCLLSGRFQVSVAWRSGKQRGPGGAIPISADAGGFWFFTPANLELTVKIVDGRKLNGWYWFFYAGLTDVGYTITVTDTQTGAVRSYTNPAGTHASVADSHAFLPGGSGRSGA